MCSGNFLYGPDSIVKRYGAGLDAGGAGHPQDGLAVFPDSLSAYAAQDCQHYFRHGAPGGGGYEIAHEDWRAGESDQCDA